MYGGGISMSNCTLIYSRNSSFKDNSARQYGGGFEAHNSILNFTGKNNYIPAIFPSPNCSSLVGEL